MPRRTRDAGGQIVRFAFAIALLLGITSSVEAALPPLSDQELSDTAELIITGEVIASRVLVHRKPGSSIYMVRLAASVNEIEKGQELLESSRSIDIRCWRMRKTNLVGPSGHSNIPADGSSFRMWLKKNDEGQWTPLEPNGIELLEGSTPITFATADKREMEKGFLWGGIAGLLALGGLIWFRMAR